MSVARGSAEPSEPARRRRGRAFFDRLEARVANSSLGERDALRRAAVLGAARGLLSGRWPAAADVAALYGTGPLPSRRLALEIAAWEACDRLVLRRVAGEPQERFGTLVRWRDPAAAAALSPPRVLVTAHAGALHLLSAALDRLAGPRLVLRWSPYHRPAAGERNASLAGGLESRARALLEARAELAAGGFVSTTLDGGNGASTAVPLFGHPLDVGLGAFYLARSAGVPIVPVIALWEWGSVVCELGAPVADPAAAVTWLEGVLRRAPGQISLGLLRRLLYGPPVGATEEQRAPL